MFAPALDLMYTGSLGGGARCNGQPISVSDRSELSDSLVGTGLPHDRRDLGPVTARIAALASRCRDIRRVGSPTLDVCAVAHGRLDAHTESLGPWDVGAAGLIAREAGAHTTALLDDDSFLPGDLRGAGYLAVTPGIEHDLRELLASATASHP